MYDTINTLYKIMLLTFNLLYEARNGSKEVTRNTTRKIF